MSFKVASKKAQASARRITNKMLGHYDESLSDSQIRENLVNKVKAIEKQLKDLPKMAVEREALGKEKFELQNKISEIRKKFKPGQDFANYICDVIKKEVNSVQWKIWVNKAKEIYEQEPTHKPVNDEGE